jgi:predicted Zn finger-like uncharacterized protein
MLIVCPTCESRYDIASDAIGAAGRSVRCSRCRTEWRVFADGAAPLPFEDDPAPGADDDVAASNDTGSAVEEAVDAQALEDGTAPPPPAPVQDSAPVPRSRIKVVKKKRKPAKPFPWAKAAIAAGLAGIVMLFAARTAVVRIAPQTASLYAHVGMPVNLRGLDFEGVRTTTFIENGVPVLIVEGFIRSLASQPTVVPRLRVSVRDDKETEIYNWTAVVTREALPPGQSVPFKTRLASPPDGAHSVVVRFLLRRDMVVASR